MSLLAKKPDTSGAHEDSAAAFVPDQSRAERKTSYAVEDFPVPGGREEEWRFTPVDRLSSLFQPAATEVDKLTVEVVAPEGVTTDRVEPAAAGGGGAGAPPPGRAGAGAPPAPPRNQPPNAWVPPLKPPHAQVNPSAP